MPLTIAPTAAFRLPHTADPEVCARCAGLGPTCCQMAPGQGEVCFPLAAVEMDRIRDVLPPGRQGWFAAEPNSAAFVASLLHLFPDARGQVRRLFPQGKEHFRLATAPDGRCLLLGEQGCSLPQEARPYYCRLFPLWLTAGKLGLLEAHCLVCREQERPQAVLRALGLTAAAVCDLHARLRLAWGLEPREDSDCRRDLRLEP